MEQIELLIETFIIVTLFLYTDIRSFGHKNKRFPVYPAILLMAAFTSGINTLFYGTSYQFYIYLALLLINSTLFAYYYIPVAITYILSLQLNMLCCFSILKTILLTVNQMLFPSDVQSAGAMAVYYISYFLLMILCSIFYYKHPLTPTFAQPAKYWITMIAVPACFLVIINLTTKLSMEELPRINMRTFSINLLIVLLLLLTHYLFYLDIRSYNELIDSKIMYQHTALQLDSIERSSALVEQIRRDKHEMKNVYFYIQTLLEDQNYDELTEFVNTKLVPRYERLEEFHTGNRLLDYLLSQKASEAYDNNIPFMADIQIPQNLPIEQNDLCSLLQNLLNNAIDASKSEPDPAVQIIINVKKGYLSVKVMNRVSQNVLHSNPTLSTTKDMKEEHGLGLKIVRSIVKKYDGMFKATNETGYFTINILLNIAR